MTEFRRCDRCKTEIEPNARHYVVEPANRGEVARPRHLCVGCYSELWPAEPTAYRPTGWMERVSKALETVNRPLSRRAVYEATGATIGNRAEKQGYVALAIHHLELLGFVRVEPGPRNTTLHTLIKPYRAAEEITP